MRPQLRLFSNLLCLLLFTLTSPAQALDAINKTTLFSVAIHGYDPVAYFESSKPVKGEDTWRYEYKGAKWAFSSEKNLALFKANPEKYAPQYGGYCAYAVSLNSTADIDPQAWKIVDGKLYLNYSPKIQRRWEGNMKQNITLADTNWPKLTAKAK